MATIKDVAKKTGTSISTVSNVINGTKYVAQDLTIRIQQAIAELGYEVNPLGRGLKSQKTGLIGMIINDMNRIFFPPMIKGVQQVLYQAGYQVTICDMNSQTEREHEFVDILRNTWADGILLDSMTPLEDETYLHKLAHMGTGKRHIPVVSLERRFPMLDSIGVNNVYAGTLAVDHLLQLGCRKIVFLSGPKEGNLSNERRQGYIVSHMHIGVPVDEKLTMQCDFSPLSGYQATDRLLMENVAFDGIFAANDQMAIGALEALHQHNIKVPEQVKVAGFDNTFVSSLVCPSLTTVSLPIFDMGREAARMLLDRMRPDFDPLTPPRWKELPVELVIRRSTSPTGVTKPDMTYW